MPVSADNLEDYSFLAPGVGSSVSTCTERHFKNFNTLLKPFSYLKPASVPSDLAKLRAYIVRGSTNAKCEEMSELFYDFAWEERDSCIEILQELSTRINLSRPVRWVWMVTYRFLSQVSRHSLWAIESNNLDISVPGIMWAAKTWEDSLQPVLHSNKGWLWPLAAVQARKVRLRLEGPGLSNAVPVRNHTHSTDTSEPNWVHSASLFSKSWR